MDSLEKKQLPFGISLALNKIALLSQERICKTIPRIFNNSKTGGIEDKEQVLRLNLQPNMLEAPLFILKLTLLDYKKREAQKDLIQVR